MATPAERKLFRQQQRLRKQAGKIQRLTGPELVRGGGERKLGRVASRYDRLYQRLKRKDPSAVEGFQPFDFGTGRLRDPEAAAGAGPAVPGQEQAQAAPTVEGVTESPFGPDFDQVVNDLVQGGIPGINLNTTKGARAMEVMFPLIQHAYNTRMQQEGVGTAAKSVGEYKEDPLLQGVAAGMTDMLADPYTFDEQTTQLMRNRISDDMANQEAAMGERLRSLGATVGMDPSSPRYASLASQAALMRDINQSNEQRKLDIELARQRKADRYQALGAAGQFGGAYQTGLGQRYAGLTGTQLGGKFQGVGNPFAGLWQGLLMEEELGKDPSFVEQWGPMIGQGLRAAGTAVGGV